MTRVQSKINDEWTGSDLLRSSGRGIWANTNSELGRQPRKLCSFCACSNWPFVLISWSSHLHLGMRRRRKIIFNELQLCTRSVLGRRSPALTALLWIRPYSPQFVNKLRLRRFLRVPEPVKVRASALTPSSVSRGPEALASPRSLLETQNLTSARYCVCRYEKIASHSKLWSWTGDRKFPGTWGNRGKLLSLLFRGTAL